MKARTLLQIIAKPLLFLVCSLILLDGTSCTMQAGNLTVSSASRGQSFSQAFVGAYSTQDSKGDSDVVLVDEPEMRALDGGHTDGSIRQIMHIRILWRPTRDSKSDHNSASNATLHWYVLGESTGDIIEYDGTAMVVLAPEDDGASLTIRNASIQPVARRGAMRDPIGPSTLRGTVRTRDSIERVRKALSEVRGAIATANSSGPTLTLGASPESPSSAAR